MAGTLRDDLLAIPGIEGAELDGDDATPAGVRVRLSTGADAEEVSRLVQRVLAEHGMRSQLNAPRIEPVEPPPPPGAAGSVVALPGLRDETVEDREMPEPELLRADEPSPPSLADEPEEPRNERPEEILPPAAVLSGTSETAADLDSVAVEEGRTGVTVRITTTSGLAVSHEAAPIADGVDHAIVGALAELTGRRAVRLVGVQESIVEGSLVLTVVVELADRTRRAGSAVSEGGRAYGVARAAWVALTLPG